jgi:hypothetical protein
MRTATTVGALLRAAHRSKHGAMHGHTWRVWATFPTLGGALDAIGLQDTLKRFLADMGDHGVLPDRLAWGEAIAEEVGRGLVADYGGVVGMKPKGLMCYASMCGEGRALDGLRRHGWGALISRNDVRDPKDLPFVIDPGTYGDFLAGQDWDEKKADAFERLIDRLGPRADWIILPDIVGKGPESLALSLRWSNRVLSVCPKVLIAVQNGMTHEDLAPLVGPSVGIFLGGTTDWKLETMRSWGEFSAARGVHYHVARVNTERRMAMAAGAGADSVDGSSAVRFSQTIGMLDRAARQPDLLAPVRA